MLLLFALVLTSCTSSTPTAGDCMPGEIRACTTGTGSETCEADGRWGPCERIPPRDGGLDSSAFDSGSRDSGGLDAGALDASADSGASDSGASDAGTSDAGTSDAGGDSSAADAGSADSGVTDAGTTTFACGPTLRCDLATQYCSILLAGPAGVPPNHSCVMLPSACATPATCACVSGSGGGACSCRMSADAVTVTCAAP